jgi:hypothetical protein
MSIDPVLHGLATCATTSQLLTKLEDLFAIMDLDESRSISFEEMQVDPFHLLVRFACMRVMSPPMYWRRLRSKRAEESRRVSTSLPTQSRAEDPAKC